jgi:hypothetical protein
MLQKNAVVHGITGCIEINKPGVAAVIIKFGIQGAAVHRNIPEGVTITHHTVQSVVLVFYQGIIIHHRKLGTGIIPQ